MLLFSLSALGASPWLTDPAKPLPPSALRTPSGAVRALIRADGSELVARGLSVRRRADGSFRGGMGFVSIEADRSVLATLHRQGFELHADRRIDLGPYPTNLTGPMVGAPQIRARPEGPTGEGVVIGDIDSHIEVTHPHFFRPDAGISAWVDVDGDGSLTPDVDGIDVDGDGRITPIEVLRELEGFTYRWDPDASAFEFDETPGVIDPRRDWLYLDIDGDGFRTAGRPLWTDSSPGLAEPTFVPDDVDGDGVIEPSERLWQLGSSVIRSVYWDGELYERGEGLTRYDRQTRDEDRSHGTGVSGILVGGQLVGQRQFGGLAPDAELVFISRYTVETLSDLLDFTEMATDLEVDVLLHEYAPWVGYSLDGTGLVEQAVDRLASEGMVQVCAAGNLADAGKHAVLEREGRASVTRIEVSENTYSLWLEWHYDAANPVACTLEGSGFSFQGSGITQQLVGDTWFWLDRNNSPGGRGRATVAVWRDDGSRLPVDTWTLRCNTPDPLDVYLSDGSGWGRGSVFIKEDRSRTMGLPATALGCVAVAASVGRYAYDQQPGALRSWSSRGPALGGQKTIDIAAPDDAFTPSAWFIPGSEGSYQLFGGTSGAAPHITALAALMKADEPDLDGLEVRQRLMDAARSEGIDPGDGWGQGRADGYAALYGDAPAEVPEPIELEVIWLPGPGPLRAQVSGAPELRWDYGYDGTIDATGPLHEVGFGEVVRVDAYRDGYRVGGVVLDGPPASVTAVEEPVGGCSTAGGPSRPWWMGLGRRREATDR